MKKRKAILKQIKALDKEVSSRVSEVNGERGLYATPEEVEALRQLAGVLVMLFGPIPMVDFD
jgi:hypothetical protein